MSANSKSPSTGPLPRAVRGIRDVIPSGYMLGRTDSGQGAVQIIPMQEWCSPPSFVNNRINTIALPKTALSSVAAHSILLGEGTASFGAVAPAASGQLLIAQGASNDPAFKALSQDATITGAGVLTVTGLQGRSVANTAPSTNQGLFWNGSAWAPKTVPVMSFGGVVVDGTDTYVAAVTSLADPELVLSNGLPVYIKNPGISASFVRGVTDGSNAPAGFVGELMSASLAVGSAINLTSNTPVDICNIALTPGDWDITGVAVFNPNGSGTTVNQLVAALTTTSATIPADPNNGGNSKESYSGFAPGSVDQVVNVGPMQLNVAANTTVYLDGRAQFGTSTMVVYGYMRARRMR